MFCPFTICFMARQRSWSGFGNKAVRTSNTTCIQALTETTRRASDGSLGILKLHLPRGVPSETFPHLFFYGTRKTAYSGASRSERKDISRFLLADDWAPWPGL